MALWRGYRLYFNVMETAQSGLSSVEISQDFRIFMMKVALLSPLNFLAQVSYSHCIAV